jgi:hypothetical protein
VIHHGVLVRRARAPYDGFTLPPFFERSRMRKSFIMVIMFVLAVLLLLPLFRPQESAAAISEAPRAALADDAPPSLPSVAPPFDNTPITPVESAGAPMHE